MPIIGTFNEVERFDGQTDFANLSSGDVKTWHRVIDTPANDGDWEASTERHIYLPVNAPKAIFIKADNRGTSDSTFSRWDVEVIGVLEALDDFEDVKTYAGTGAYDWDINEPSGGNNIGMNSEFTWWLRDFSTYNVIETAKGGTGNQAYGNTRTVLPPSPSAGHNQWIPPLFWLRIGLTKKQINRRGLLALTVSCRYD